MDRKLKWYEYITINIHYLGISTVTGSVTPLLLPFIVALLVTPERKNTDLATIRVISLAVAMAAQPLAGSFPIWCQRVSAGGLPARKLSWSSCLYSPSCSSVG